MRLILHIGTEKTATTTIQRFLYDNRQALRDARIGLSDVLDKPNNRALPSFCMPDENFDDYFQDRRILSVEAKRRHFKSFKSDFARELEGLAPWADTLLVTSEHFHSRLTTIESIERLKRFADEFFTDVLIVCYFREQSSLARSIYSTAIKEGATAEDLNSFVRRCTPENDYYNYHTFLGNWRHVFGPDCLRPRIYAESAFVGGDIRKDLLAQVDERLDLESFDYPADRENTSLGAVGVRLGCINNTAGSRYNEDGSRNAVWQQASRVIQRAEFGRLGRTPFPAAQSIYDSFRESNVGFAREFLGEARNPFPRPAELPAEVDDGGGHVPLEAVLDFFESLLGALALLPQVSDADANVLRDLALRIERRESTTIGDARDLMALAHRIRPDGAFIQQKLREYERQTRHVPQ